MSRNISPIINGGILIMLGCIFLAANLYDFDAETYWPVFFLIPILLSFGAFLRDRKNAGALIPVAIFIIMGAVFQYCVSDGWHNMEWLWPAFILGPGLGILLQYSITREQRLLIPTGILIGLSAIFFLTTSPYSDLWPLLLIIAGGALMWRRRKNE